MLQGVDLQVQGTNQSKAGAHSIATWAGDMEGLPSLCFSPLPSLFGSQKPRGQILSLGLPNKICLGLAY